LTADAILHPVAVHGDVRDNPPPFIDSQPVPDWHGATFILPDNGRKRLSKQAATVAAGQAMVAHWLASR
jgi:hypothetical protein